MDFSWNAGPACWLRRSAALLPALFACAAFAAERGEHREHAAHAHGHGTLDIVVEGEELAIELRIPAVNAVGFEHAPRDDAERARIRKALVAFGDAAKAVALPAAAKCEVEEAKAEIAGITHEDDHGERHAHGKEDHAEHEKEDAEPHSELHASWHFHCHAPGRLGRIDLRALAHLHDVEEIDVRIVTPKAQRATELRPGATIVELAP